MNAKNKGSAFERLISKQLSLWWSEGKRDDIFWRSQSSGGWNTIRRRRGKNTSTQYGDIQAIDAEGKPLLEALCIELKTGYGKWCLLDFVDKGAKNKEQVFEKFFKQLIEDWKISGSAFPCLIAKRNSRKAVIFIPISLYAKIKMMYGVIPSEVFLTFSLINIYPHICICVDFDTFLKWCDPQFFKERLWK